jgi:hypothetical protein
MMSALFSPPLFPLLTSSLSSLSLCFPVVSGTGKTTFIKMLAGLLKPDEGCEIPLLNVSYKPQKIAPKVRRAGTRHRQDALIHSTLPPFFSPDVNCRITSDACPLPRPPDYRLRQVEGGVGGGNCRTTFIPKSLVRELSAATSPPFFSFLVPASDLAFFFVSLSVLSPPFSSRVPFASCCTPRSAVPTLTLSSSPT